MRVPESRYADVVVIGARIAGAAAAWSLAPYAGDVLLLERSAPGVFWPQAASWDRHANLLWHELGLTETVLGCDAPSIRGHIFQTGKSVINYNYPDDDQHCYRMCIEREKLDSSLVGKALSRGNVRLLRGARASRVLTEEGQAVGVAYRHGGHDYEVRASLVVLADGRVSRTADSLGIGAYEEHPSPWSSFMYYCEGVRMPPERAYYSRQTGTLAVLAPCGPTTWCASASIHRELVRRTGQSQIALFHQALDHDPLIGPALIGSRRVSPVGGAGKLVLRRRPMAGPGWCLLGDCGYFLDPLTALGTRAALTAVRLLRDQVIRVGSLRAEELHQGLTQLRDAQLDAGWERTVRAVGHCEIPAAQLSRAEAQAADPAVCDAVMREQMGLPPAHTASSQSILGR